ncbi:hypothetical protein JYT58_01370, partial [bacterium AH-315-G11]|nr:hypothetical protein [bacterium AH-315-G11]
KRGNDWKLRYHVVSSTLSAKYALVLGSSSGKGAVTLHAKFPIKSIVDIDLKDLSLSWDRSVSWHILDNEGDGCVPFIKLSKVNDPLLAKPSFEPVR